MNINLEVLSEFWAEVMLRATLHGAIFIGILLILGLLFEKHLTKQTDCWLWRIVFLKLILLVLIVQPIGIPILPSQSSQQVHAANETQLQPSHHGSHQSSFAVQPVGSGAESIEAAASANDD